MKGGGGGKHHVDMMEGGQGDHVGSCRKGGRGVKIPDFCMSTYVNSPFGFATKEKVKSINVFWRKSFYKKFKN